MIDKLAGYKATFEKHPVIIVIFFAFISYVLTISFGWVLLDDKGMIEEVLELYSEPASLINVFTHEYASFFRPLQILTFALESYIAGNDPAFYHFVNVLLHTIISALVFILFLKMSYPKLISLSIAMIFAVHPLFTHAVAWIPSRGDLLLALFGLLSFIYFLNYLKEKKYPDLFHHNIFLLLALLSKETAAMIPVIVFVYAILMKNKELKSFLYLLTGWILCLGIWYFLRSLTIASDISSEVFGFGPLMSNIRIIPELAGKFFLPCDLSTLPGFSFSNTIMGILFLIVLAVFSFLRKNTRENHLIFGFVWYLLFLFPSLLFRLPHSDIYFDYFEHRAYLASVGLFVIIAELISSFDNEKYRKYIKIGAVAIIAIFFTLALYNSLNYKNGIRFWSQGIRDNPDRPMLYNGLANALIIEGKTEQAEKALKKSLKIDPSLYDTQYRLAKLYFENNKMDKALKHFTQAFKIFPNSTEANVNLALVYMETGQHTNAAEILKNALRIDPNNLTYLFNIIDNYKKAAEYDSAFKYIKILEQKGQRVDFVRFFMDWSSHLASERKFNLAVRKARQALSLDPKNKDVLNSIGVYYASQGKMERALSYWESALKNDPEYLPALQNFYKYYYDKRMYDKALIYADMIIKYGGSIDQEQLRKLKGSY